MRKTAILLLFVIMLSLLPVPVLAAEGGSLDVSGSRVKITGPASLVGENVTIIVEDLSGNRAYIDETQAKSDEGKAVYSFEFSLGSGTYTAKVYPEQGSPATYSGITVEASDYLLLPENLSRNNLYNGEISVAFDNEVSVVSPSEGSVQVLLNGTHIEGTPEGNPQAPAYPKEYADVLTVPSASPTKAVVDLSRAGDRLDVNHTYEITIRAGSLMVGGSILTEDITWSFDTEWSDKAAESKMTVSSSIRLELLELNGFYGLYTGQAYTFRDKPTSSDKEYDYPIEYEALTPEIMQVDRSGRLTAVSSGNAAIRLWIPQTGKEAYVYLEVRDVPKQKMQVVKRVQNVGKNMSTSGNFVSLSLQTGEGYLHDRDLELKSTFRHNLTAKGGSGSIYTINGRDYVEKADDNISGTPLSLIDAETGEVWRSGISTGVLPSVATGKWVNGYSMQLSPGSPLILTYPDSNKYALYDAEADEVLWQVQGLGYTSYAQSDGQGIYVLAQQMLRKIDKDTGATLWNTDVTDLGYNDLYMMYLGSGRVYAVARGTAGDAVMCVDADNGRLIDMTEDYREANLSLYVDEDGYVYYTAQKGNMPAQLYRWKPEEEPSVTGVTFDSAINFRVFGRDASGNLYTSTAVLDKDMNTIAYADFCDGEYDMSGTSVFFHDGRIYRYVTKGISDKTNYTEMMELLPVYESQLTGIKAENTQVYEEGTISLNAAAVDQYGYNMAEKLKYEVMDGADMISVTGDGVINAKMLSADVTSAGAITYDCKVNISIEGYDIATAVTVTLRQKPVPDQLYAVGNKINSVKHINECTIVDKIAGETGNLRGGFFTFVADQHGELMTDQLIEYTIDDENITGALYYQDVGDKYEYKYQCALSGRKAGKTFVTVRLPNHTEVEPVTVDVEITDLNYALLWEIPTDGDWNNKFAAHTDGISNDFIYSNINCVTAVDKRDGSRLWRSDVGAYYGMEISEPYCDSEGRVYIYDKNKGAVAALDSTDMGARLWHAYFGDSPVAQMAVTSEWVYVMDELGLLWQLNKADGSVVCTVDVGQTKSADMEVAPDGTVYVASQGTIYKVEDGSLTEIASLDRNADISCVSDSGLIVVKLSISGGYAAMCMDSSGRELWRAGIADSFTAAWDKDRLYVWSANAQPNMDRLYAFDAEGSKLYETTMNTRGHAFITRWKSERRPVVKNGKVYVYPIETFCYDANSGEELWSTYIRDTFTGSPPVTLTVGDDGIVYVSTGARGMFAYVVKGASTGFAVSASGRPSLNKGSLNEISFTVSNGTDQAVMDAVITVTVENADTGKIVESWSVKKDFAAMSGGDIQSASFACGMEVPAEGRYRLTISVTSGKDVLDELSFETVE